MGWIGDVMDVLGYKQDQKLRQATEAREQAREQRELERAQQEQMRLRQEAQQAEQQRREENENRRRSHAALVYATVDKRTDDDGYYTLGVTVHNTSPTPVHDVQVVVAMGAADAPFTTVRSVCQPGETFIAKKKPWDRSTFDFDLPVIIDKADAGRFQPYAVSDRFRVHKLVFRDINGTWWTQDDNGVHEIAPVKTPLKSKGRSDWKPKPKKTSTSRTADEAVGDASPVSDQTAEAASASAQPETAPAVQSYTPTNPFAAASTPKTTEQVENASAAETQTTTTYPSQHEQHEQTEQTEQTEHPKPLFDALKDWRTFRYRADGVKAYEVATNKVLEAIAEKKPTTVDELRYIPGIGKAKCEKYGEEILKVVERNR